MAKIHQGSFVKNAISQGAQGYALDLGSVVSMEAFPTRPTQGKREGSYYVFTRADMQRIQHDGRRAADGYAKGTEYGLGTDTYACEHISSRHLVTADEVASAGGIYDAKALYSAAEANMVLRIMEDRWATEFFTTGVWTATGSDSTPSTGWNATLAGSPRADIRQARDAIRAVLGREPMHLIGICGATAFSHLEMHPELVDWGGVANAQGDIAKNALFNSREQVAAKLGLDAIYVSNANKVTSREGAGSETRADIVGDGFLVLHVNPAPFDLQKPTAACTFVNKPLYTRTYTDDGLLEGSFYVEADIDLDFELVAAELGFFWQNVIT